MRLPLVPGALFGTESSTQPDCLFSRRRTILELILVRNIVLQIPVLQFYSQENLQLANVSSLYEYLSLPSRSALFFLLWDHMMTGIALPKLPYIEYIGGITAGPARELNNDLKNWADSATNGFVMCTFGSMLTAPTESTLEKLFYLFSELQPLPVIFKISRENLPEKLIPRVSKNVLMMDWLPQNDLLGHPNARLFITHAGTNGYGEALYHGVPLIAFPLMIPQQFIAKRIEALGFGREASLFTTNNTELAAMAKEVLIDTRYRQRVGKVSKIMKSRKHPGEVATDAVEHVMEFGADHLRSYGSLSLNIIEFFMLDIFGLVFVLILGLLLIGIYIFSLLLKCIWRMNFLLWKRGIKTKTD